jgi:hypothetical protein
MATIENNMAIMKKQFSTWMTELRKNENGYGSQPNATLDDLQQPNQDKEISLPGSQKT